MKRISTLDSSLSFSYVKTFFFVMLIGCIGLSKANGNGLFTGVYDDPKISSVPLRLYDNDVAGGAAGTNRTVTLQNTASTGILTVSSISLSGANADQFLLSNVPALPLSLSPGESLAVQVAFNPSTAGLKTASLLVQSNDPLKPSFSVPLRGLGTTGTSGSGEPSLQALLNLLEVPINVGDDNSATTVIYSNTTQQKAPLLGEEVSLQKFVKADGSQPVTITPLAVFGPASAGNPVLGAGWYTAGDANSKQELFTVPNTTGSGQTVNVMVSGALSFDPGSAAFGFYSRWPFFSNRLLYSEDALNSFSGAVPHHVRVYPYKDPQSGGVVPFTYLVAFEENTSALDYQDLVFIVKNVKVQSAQSSAVGLSAIADASVQDGASATTNFGLENTLKLKGTTSVGLQRAAYLKFALGGVSDVVSAKLRFYGRNTENTASITASVLGVDTDDWTEQGITWNNAPATSPTALGTVPVNNQLKYYEVDVTSFVQAQLQKDKVASFALKDLTNQNRQLLFNSRENVLNQPQLVITTSAALASSNTYLFVENLDRFPSNTDFMASRLQHPWSRDGVVFNTNHDTLRIRLWNKGVGTLVVSKLSLSNTDNWKIITLKGASYDPATQLPLNLVAGASADLQVKFITQDSVGLYRAVLDELSILSNDDKEPYKTLNLRGLWQNFGEGSKEPKAGAIMAAFGFKTKTGFTNYDPDKGANNKPKGDEVLTAYFVRADASKPVTARQMSAYHGCCDIQQELLRWFPKGKKDSLTRVVLHVAEDAQTVLPRRNSSFTSNLPAEGNLNPNTAFGFRIGSQDWSDTALNDGKKIGIRIWKAIDAKGQVIPNAYIISNDYLGTSVTNYDYNDNMYYLTNLRPELGPASTSALASTPSAVDFGEQVLQNQSNFTLNLQSLGQVNGSISDPALTINAVNIVGQNASEFTASMPVKSTLAAGETTTLNLGFKPTSEGLKVADLLIYYNNAGSPLRVPLYALGKAAGTIVTVRYRIKSGSSTDVTVNGKTYVADTPYAFDNLEPFTNASLTQVSATDEDALYLTEQSSNADKRPFRYEMTVPNGTYWVRLHFSEIFWGVPGGNLTGGAGSRVMGLTVEGQPRVLNFDIAGEVGAASALVKVMPVTVTDGKLNINFSATSDRPSISAIEVYQFTSAISLPVEVKEPTPDVSQYGKIRVYPNPLHQQFTIELSGAYKGNTVLKLVDAAGRVNDLGTTKVPITGVKLEMDLASHKLPPGMYFLHIRADNGKTETIKLLLQ